MAELVARLASATSVSSGNFTCGGKLVLLKPVRLQYKHREAWAAVHLPAPSPDALDQLVSACTPAGFGLGKQLVHDETVRKALELEPNAFLADLQLAAYDILAQVQHLLKPDSNSVAAELYKLNVYEAGGFFESHVDTPRGGGMFGSLVVCLPSPHTGGQLIVTHAGNIVEHSWQDASATHMQWAAFYSDCAHAVRPVTSGRRITLTYNLYSRDAIAPAVDYSLVPAYRELQALLLNPAALPDGGTLGFGCMHVYAHNSQLFTSADLKGADAALYWAAAALGLEVSLNPAWHSDGADPFIVGGKLPVTLSNDYEGCHDVGDFDSDTEYHGPTEREMLEKVYGPSALWEEGAITWVTQPSHQLVGLVGSAYTGNGAETDTKYHMAAILISIPPAAQRVGCGPVAPSKAMMASLLAACRGHHQGPDQ